MYATKQKKRKKSRFRILKKKNVKNVKRKSNDM